jgi:hypothetical protein
MIAHRLLTRTWLLLVACLLGLATSKITAAPISGLSQLGGWAYIDRNNDGALAFSADPNPEFAIGEVEISLYSVVANVETFLSTIETDEFGRYLFENINPGTYTLRQTQPVDFVDGRDTLGILVAFTAQPIPGSASVGTAIDNAFLNIVLTADVGGEYFNFGERGLTAGAASKRFLFATPPPNTPPPPPGDPPIPEPTSLILALLAACGSVFASRWSRRS